MKDRDMNRLASRRGNRRLTTIAGTTLVGFGSVLVTAVAGALPGLAAGGLVCLAAGAASAQATPQTVEPHYLIITQDQAPLLAGPVETHYRVALLPVGSIVRATHAMDGWVLAEYPGGANAYVRSSEVTLSPDARTVRTNVATRLRAANMESTAAGSWATLLAEPLEPLAAGTELRVVSVENRADGTPSFYKVVAPAQSRGFLRAGVYREATPQETQDHLNRLAMAERDGSGGARGTDQAGSRPGTTPGTNPATNPATTPGGTPGTTSSNPTTPPATNPANPSSPSGAQPNPAAGTPTSGGLDSSLLTEPAVPAEGDRPALPATAATGDLPLVIDQSGTITGGSPDSQPASTEAVTLTVDGLKAAFDAIRELPVREAEYEELIARFGQVINTLGDSREDERLKRWLQAHADLLRLRQEYRDSLLELDEGRRDARDLAARATERIDWLRTQGGYAVIGRLVPSNIYDGSSGPLMYRVVAVNTDVPRTLAYVKMDDQFTLPEMVGKVVGVRGEVMVDPTIGTRIVQAESVDEVETQEP